MENDLVSIYENNYLKAPVITEKKFTAEPDVDADVDGDDDDAPENCTPRSKPQKNSMKRRKHTKDDIGGITYDSHKRTETIFDKILREMNEMGGDAGDMGEDPNAIYDSGEEEYADEESIPLSQLRNMTIGDIIAMLDGGQDEEDVFDDQGSDEPVDEIPSESTENSVYFGSQGNYSGKNVRQPASTRVKSNGDADFSDADTGYDPEDTGGTEGAEHGAQGDYDGKAKRQPASSHVKSNGNADYKQAKTPYKTSSGKKPKNYF